jgi:predicted ATPase
MQLLKRIRLVGYKSIYDQTIELTPLNVVIGANGSGKSNLLSLFKMLEAMFAQQPNLSRYIAKIGGADSFFHYGVKQTQVAELEIKIQKASETYNYQTKFAPHSGSLVLHLAEEKLSVSGFSAINDTSDQTGLYRWESKLVSDADGGNQCVQEFLQLMRSCKLYHFHDTSPECAARQPCYVEANRFLYPDAGNLAAMLYLFQQKHPVAYRRITSAVRHVMPEFRDFILEPSRLNETQIILKWQHQRHDYEFGPHQLSDGSLRFIALATLLLQPKEHMPMLIALDEPELGLHPSALELLTGIIRSVSTHTQMLVSTQSQIFVDFFAPEEVITANCKEGRTEFNRLNPEKYQHWLEDYSLGELWQRNVISAGPYS